MGDRKGMSDIEAMAEAADLMSMGDSVSVQLRTN
jgi:hypothetical protein